MSSNSVVRARWQTVLSQGSSLVHWWVVCGARVGLNSGVTNARLPRLLGCHYRGLATLHRSACLHDDILPQKTVFPGNEGYIIDFDLMRQEGQPTACVGIQSLGLYQVLPRHGKR